MSHKKKARDLAIRIRQVEALYRGGTDFQDAIVIVKEFMSDEEKRSFLVGEKKA